MDVDTISKFLNEVNKVTEKPEKYLCVQESCAEEIKQLTRNLYNFSKQKENPKKKCRDALDQLVLTNLDDEQIWQQVELQNNSIFDLLLNDISHLMTKKDNLIFPLKSNKKTKKNKIKEDKLPLSNEEKNHNFNEEDEEDFSEESMEVKKKKKMKAKPGKPSIVDDKFFKLYEMETFLDKWENSENNDYDDDDEEIDYFEADSLDENDSVKQLHYDDFFDQPEDNIQNDDRKREMSESEEEGEKRIKKVKFALTEDENIDETDEEDEYYNYENEEFDNGCLKNVNDELQNSEDSEDEDEEECTKEKQTVTEPSTFEARQERLKLRISALEEEALREKPWQLKGEVTATNRPQNSLLQEYVEFDVATRPAPIITEKSTFKLEDIILQRIKDKAWDDVVRKIKPVESEMDYKKKLVLDQEKSKLSLAQIYEQEYLKQMENKTENLRDKPEVEPPEHQEIRIMMNKLFYKLDALSNFHFTPKQVEPEIKIISNLPAINMEEVAPVATSDAALLAPEEVKPKFKGQLIGKSERTSTDKKRERRKKKLKQKLKHKKLEAIAKDKLEKGSKNVSKTLSTKLLQKITKTTNISQLQGNEDEKFVKSSQGFFSKLQDDSRSAIKKDKKLKLGKKLKKKKSEKT